MHCSAESIKMSVLKNKKNRKYEFDPENIWDDVDIVKSSETYETAHPCAYAVLLSMAMCEKGK